MRRAPRVEAVVVNHNTSLFAELALRSLLATHATAADACELRVTVRDNHSTDRHSEALRLVTRDLGVSFERSEWPAAHTALNSHGDVLRDFVEDHPDADYILFADADIDFDEPATLATLIDDLTADPTLWAVQARYRWLEDRDGPGASLDIWTGRDVELTFGAATDGQSASHHDTGQVKPRLHPGCALVRNSAPVRTAVITLGLGVAVVQSGRSDIAGLFDTAGLVSAALAVAELHYGFVTGHGPS